VLYIKKAIDSDYNPLYNIGVIKIGGIKWNKFINVVYAKKLSMGMVTTLMAQFG
jgi:hypothetical protein